MTLSAVIIALNEKDMIAGAVVSCRFADEVLVVDGGSSDDTVAIARNAGARVVERPFDDFARQRTFALAEAAGEWVLFVDADERVTPGLAREVRAAAGRATADGYEIPRRNLVLGRWLDWHFGGGVDAPVRLVRAAVARLADDGVHERLVVDGTVARCTERLVHLTHRSVGDVVDKINRYSEIEAAEAAARGARVPSRRAIAAEFPRSFWRYWRSGLRREGSVGAIEAALLAFNRTLVLAKVWERAHREPIAEAYEQAEMEASR